MNTMELIPEPIDKSLTPDRRTWWATLFLLCAILGAMLGLSVRTQNVKQQQENIAKQKGNDVLIIANADLQRRIAQLQKDNAQLVKSTPSDTERMRLLSKDLAKAQFLAGLTDVKGPGVIVILNDSKLPYPKDMPPGMTPVNIIHDTDINQVVNELKAAKSEAISINDQRLVAISPVRCAGPTIYVNDTPQTPPYVIKAIGSPKILETSLNISNGIADQIRRFDPAMMKIEKSSKPLVIPAYSGAIEPKYAVPAATTTASGPDKKPGV